MNGSFFSPEAAIMLPFAVFFDLIGVALLFFGLDDFWITDVIAFSFIGTWMFIRSRSIKTTKSTAAKAGKVAKKMKKIKWLRPLCFLGELIPYVGAAPGLTILVYTELKS